jgi:hypothetical protein
MRIWTPILARRMRNFQSQGPTQRKWNRQLVSFYMYATSIYWYVLVCTIIELFSLAGIIFFGVQAAKAALSWCEPTGIQISLYHYIHVHTCTYQYVPVCTSIYQYIPLPVPTSTYQYILVCTGTSIYQYIPVHSTY